MATTQRITPSISSSNGRKRQKLDETSEVPGEPIRCSPCNKYFTTRRAYLRHQRENRRHQWKPFAIIEQITCAVCGRSFARAHDRERHYKEQHLHGKATCVECGKLVRPNSPHKNATGSACSGSQGISSPRSNISTTESDSSAAGSKSSSTWSNSSSTENSPSTSSTSLDLSHCEGFLVGNRGSVMDSLREQLARTTIGSTPMCPKAYKSQVRTAKPERPLPCGICRMTFEIHDTVALFEHLNDHFDGLNGKHRCGICQIDFVHAADLERHQLSASKGDCGFKFHHRSPCSGHHSPRAVRSDGLDLGNDNDRFSFCYRIRLWEQSQLQTFVSSVRSLIKTERVGARRQYSGGANGMTELNRCSDSRCRNCNILKFHQQELGTPKSKEAHVGKRGNCRNLKLVKNATAELVQHLSKSQINPSPRRRSSSFSEGCPVYASSHRDVEVVDKVGGTSIAPNPSYFGDYWQRILHRAAGAGEVELVKLAIANGGVVDGPDLDGRTALHLATVAGAMDVVEVLMHAGSHIGVCDNGGNSALMVAVRQRSLDMTRLLLRHGAMTDTIKAKHAILQLAFNKDLFELGSFLDSTTEMRVATDYRKHVWQMLLLLLNYGALCDIIDANGDTALHLAAAAGHLEAAQLLLEHGAGLNKKNEYDWTPLEVSKVFNHLDVFQLFIKQGAPTGDLDLIWLIERNADVEVVNMLLDRGIDVNVTNADGWSALEAACTEGCINMVRLLIKRGAEVNRAPIAIVRNPLVQTATNGRSDILTVLLANGARTDIEFGGRSVGSIAMHTAAAQGQTAAVQLLLDNGVDISERAHHSHTVLCEAASSGHVETVEILVANGVDLERRCQCDHTALISAAERSQLDVMRYLVSRGADVRAKDKWGHTSLCTIARCTGDEQAVRILLNAGAEKADCFSCRAL